MPRRGNCVRSSVACPARIRTTRATGGCDMSGMPTMPSPGFAGPKAEAEEIKSRLAAFPRDDLRLELNRDKTLLTHAKTGAASFPGYQVTVWPGKTARA